MTWMLLVLGIIILGAVSGAAAGYGVVRWYARVPEKTPLSPTGFFCEVKDCTTPALKHRQADGRRVCAEHKARG